MRYCILIMSAMCILATGCSGTPMNGVPAGDNTVAGATVPPPSGHLSFQESVNRALGTQIWNGLYYKLTITAPNATIVMHAFGTTFTHHGSWTQDVRQGFFNYFTVIPDAGYAVSGFDGDYANDGTADFTTYADHDQTVTVGNPPTGGG